MEGFEVHAVDGSSETAITNNIPIQGSGEHDATPESMFAGWMTCIRKHMRRRCEFTIEPNFEVTARVEDWNTMAELVREVSSDTYESHKEWLGYLRDNEVN